MSEVNQISSDIIQIISEINFFISQQTGGKSLTFFHMPKTPARSDEQRICRCGMFPDFQITSEQNFFMSLKNAWCKIGKRKVPFFVQGIFCKSCFKGEFSKGKWCAFCRTAIIENEKISNFPFRYAHLVLSLLSQTATSRMHNIHKGVYLTLCS